MLLSVNKDCGIRPRMSKDRQQDAKSRALSAQETINVLWNQLLTTASAVLQCLKTSNRGGTPEKKTREKIQHKQTYEIQQEDLDILQKYVGIYCSKFKYGSDKEEIYQELVVELLRTDYLSRFDDEKNTKSGFISRFTYHYFCKLFKIRNYAVNRAVSIDEMVMEMPERPGSEMRISPTPALEKIALHLDEEFPHTSGVRYKDSNFIEVVYVGEEAEEGEIIIWRSMSNIFRLTAMGFLQDEIARVFKVSKGWISKQVDRIRSVEVVREWAKQEGATLNSK